MFILAQAAVFTDGNMRIQFEQKDIPVSKRLRMSLMWIQTKNIWQVCFSLLKEILELLRTMTMICELVLMPL